VYSARGPQGQVVGVVQTALANIAPMEADGTRGSLRTVRFFQNVVVAKSWRRKGVATSLLNFADAADPRFASALCVEEENEAAVQLYRRLGFEIVSGEPEREGVRLMLRSAR
jgi:ribosomal protein S18 acetylase RimI-like enzyme